MIKFDISDVNDFEELQLMALKEMKKGDPVYINEYPLIYDCYAYYIRNNGNPWKIVKSILISQDCKSKLQDRYDYQLKDTLTFIEEIRNKISPDVCPMCGSYSTGTVDHYLPQSQYKEFSVLSSNLIPACLCNTKRGTSVKGANQNERPIHPYYDNLGGNLLYIATFQGSFEAPSIELKVNFISQKYRPVLDYHLEHIILRTNILDWMIKQWGKLLNVGYGILKPYIQGNSINSTQLIQAIELMLNSRNINYGTKNHWESFFYEGLINDVNRIKKLTMKLKNQKKNLGI